MVLPHTVAALTPGVKDVLGSLVKSFSLIAMYVGVCLRKNRDPTWNSRKGSRALVALVQSACWIGFLSPAYSHPSSKALANSTT